MTSETFADLGLSPAIVDTLGDLGYETPTPIQASAVPALLEGRDVVGLAQTGTGKTAAFALPILQRLDPQRKQTQALVLAPTRELALQVCEAITAYAARIPGIRVLPVYGGQGYGCAALRAGARRPRRRRHAGPRHGPPRPRQPRPDVASSTWCSTRPTRCSRWVSPRTSSGSSRDTPEYKQVALFSATMPRQIRALAKRYLHDPVDIATPEARTSTATVRQRWIQVIAARQARRPDPHPRGRVR